MSHTSIQALIDELYPSSPIFEKEEENKTPFDILASQLYDLKQTLKGMEEHKERLEKELKALVDNKSFTSPLYVFVCESKKGNVDYKSIPELASVDLERYRKSSTSVWKLIKL